MKENTQSESGLRTASDGKQIRLSIWLQFPRRLLFLLVAFALGALLFFLWRATLGANDLQPGGLFDWGRSLAFKRPVSEIISERFPNTLLLLGLAFLVAFLISLVTTSLAFLVRRLETRSTGWGFFLNRLGRLWIFSDIALPSFALGLGLVWLFGVRFELLPLAGMTSPGSEGELADKVRHLILPVSALVFMPAGLAAQAAARRMRRAGRKGIRLWLSGILNILAGLFRQTGGVLGAVILVETVFAWPGFGRMIFDAAVRRDLPLLFGSITITAALVLAGRLLSELFDWLSRLADPEPAVPPEPDARLRKTRRVWLIFVLVLFATIFGLTILGLTMSEEAIYNVSVGERLATPTSEHWLGTDTIGRDIWARLSNGTALTFVAAAIASGITLLAFPVGLLAGWLSRRKKWWADLLSDLILLPADISLFLPVVLWGMLWLVAFQVNDLFQPETTWLLVGFLTAIFIAPRMLRIAAQCWADAPEGKVFKRVGVSLVVLLFGGLFIAFAAVTSLSFLGLGIQPPVPSLGGTLAELAPYVFTNDGFPIVVTVALPLWFSLWVFYLVADTFLDDWLGKDALTWLNS